MSILIKNGNVIFEDKVLKKDILINNNYIKKIDDDISEKTDKVIDATDKYIFPGVIDPHTHLDLDLGIQRVSSDSFETGSNAALNGGVTTMFTFAHQELENETLKNAYCRRKKMAISSKNKILFHSGIMHLSDDIENQIEEISELGVKSFKIYLNNPNTNSELLYRCFKKVKEINGKILLHCEDYSIIEFLKNELKKNNKISSEYIPESRPDFLEYYSITQCAILAEQLGTEIYIVHLSSGKSAKLICELQNRGIKINAETCSQYLLLTDSVYKKKDGYIYTCTPPFRKKEDNKILWDYLKQEIIKFIATDHCPFMLNQKEKYKNDFTKFVYGLPGVEISPILMISEMKKRNFDFPLISRLLSTNIAKYFNLFPSIGVLKNGSYADLFIYNPNDKTILSHKTWKTNCDFNQFEGWECDGKIENVILNGKIIK
jgi:dihydropyrimidinase